MDAVSDKTVSHTFVNLRIFVFCLIILFYGAFGLPTPDRPGLIEALVGLGLVLSIGLPQTAFGILTSPQQEPLWMKPARLLLIYGLSVPIIAGLLIGNEMGAMIRDIFPFLFMMLPFFVYDLFRAGSSVQQKCILASVLSAGLFFSVRGYLSIRDSGYIAQNIDALYLVNAPTVLFAALFMGGYALMHFRLKRPAIPILAAFMTLIPLAAMGAVLQRASFGAFIISIGALWVLVARKSLLRAVVILIGCIFVLIILNTPAFNLLEGLLEKNRAVGSNMRLFELQAVWERVAESSLTALFGQGWGGTVQSPAVGDLTVNYTHSLISASLLKTGLVGTMLTLVYLGTLFLRFPAIYKYAPVMAFALFWPFVIDIFLYASYKSLDFGFILMLIACYGLCKKEKWHGECAKNIDDQSGLSAIKRADGSSSL